MSKSLLNQKTDEEFAEIVATSFSIVECEQRLGYTSYSGDVSVKIKNRIKVLNLDTSHFSNNQKIKRNKSNVFIENSTANQSTLRKFYLAQTDIPYVCTICGQEPFWNNQDMTLILDHINGINNDHRLSNLRWVCPNCNSQLPTTGSRNLTYQGGKTTKKLFQCLDCGCSVTKESSRCVKCYTLLTTKNPIDLPITREELKNKIYNETFCEIGRYYGVSDNTIRKWCIKFNLPHRKKDIANYSQEDWELI